MCYTCTLRDTIDTELDEREKLSESLTRETDRILYNLLYRGNLTSGGDIQVAASLRPALAMGRSYALAGDRPGIFPSPIHPSRSSGAVKIDEMSREKNSPVEMSRDIL